MEPLKLNIGCGENYLDGYCNIDLFPQEVIKSSNSPDVFCNVVKEKLPFGDGTVTEIVCSHNIEHLPFVEWPHVLFEFNRVLVPGGELLLTYPEFEIVSKYFLENHRGMRDFWRMTLYGRQAHEGDFHISPVYSPELAWHLKRNGFERIKYTPEPNHEYNTIMMAFKSEKKILTREDILREEVCK